MFCVPSVGMVEGDPLGADGRLLSQRPGQNKRRAGVVPRMHIERAGIGARRRGETQSHQEPTVLMLVMVRGFAAPPLGRKDRLGRLRVARRSAS
jgi:hypothetical protein